MDSAYSLESITALREAVEYIGSQSATARLLGVTQAAISKRLQKKQPAAPRWVLTLERETGIPRWKLRPDIYPPGDPVLSHAEGRSPRSTDRKAGPVPPYHRGSGLSLGEPVR